MTPKRVELALYMKIYEGDVRSFFEIVEGGETELNAGKGGGGGQGSPFFQVLSATFQSLRSPSQKSVPIFDSHSKFTQEHIPPDSLPRSSTCPSKTLCMAQFKCITC